MGEERELKLGAPVGFELPELGGPDDGFVAEPLPPRRYRTVYYDTPDLRLARWRSSLRHRSDEGWTVKLPAEAEGPMLVRGEHEFAGDARRPPQEAVELVRAFVRTAEVAPVARTRTVRHRLALRDQAGATLGELVEDEVQVLDGRRVAERYRELELEVTADAPAELVDRVVARLREAGAGPPGQTGKYQRALHGRVVAEPEVVPPEVGPDASVLELLRHDLAASTLRLFRHEAAVRLGEDPEAVHQARVATRRIRSSLRTFRKLLEPEWTDRLRAELKWLAGRLGAVRDADVLLERLRRDLASLPPPDAAAGERLLGGLERQRDADRRALLRAMAEPRYRTLLDDLVAAAAAPALLPGADAPAAEALPRRVAKPWKRLAKEVKAAGADPSDEQLHRIRVRAKRARYAAEAVVPVIGKDAERFAEAVEEVQDVLGDQHDAVVAEARVRELAAGAGHDEALAAGLLAAAERAEAERGRRAWRDAWQAADRKRLRAWL